MTSKGPNCFSALFEMEYQHTSDCIDVGRYSGGSCSQSQI